MSYKESNEPVLERWGESRDVCFQMYRVKAKSCQKNKCSSQVKILENSVLWIVLDTGGRVVQVRLKEMECYSVAVVVNEYKSAS